MSARSTPILASAASNASRLAWTAWVAALGLRSSALIVIIRSAQSGAISSVAVPVTVITPGLAGSGVVSATAEGRWAMPGAMSTATITNETMRVLDMKAPFRSVTDSGCRAFRATGSLHSSYEAPPGTLRDSPRRRARIAAACLFDELACDQRRALRRANRSRGTPIRRPSPGHAGAACGESTKRARSAAARVDGVARDLLDDRPMVRHHKAFVLLATLALSLAACALEPADGAADRDRALQRLQDEAAAPVTWELGATGATRVLAMTPRFPVPGHHTDAAAAAARF